MHILITRSEFHEYGTTKIDRTWMVKQKMCHGVYRHAMCFKVMRN